MGKEDHVPDGRRVGEQHGEPVDPDALAGRGRHPVLQGAHVVLIHPVRLLVTEQALLRLLLEASSLVNGIVELGICVGDLAAANEELEAVDKPRVARLALGQRRELDGEIGDESRLDQRGLDQSVEDFLPQANRSRAGLRRGHGRGDGRRPELALFSTGSHAEADGRRQGLEERQAPPGPPEVYLLLLIPEGRAPENLAAEMGEHLLGEGDKVRSEEHTSELQSRPHLVCRLLLEKKKTKQRIDYAQKKKKKIRNKHRT